MVRWFGGPKSSRQEANRTGTLAALQHTRRDPKRTFRNCVASVGSLGERVRHYCELLAPIHNWTNVVHMLKVRVRHAPQWRRGGAA